MSVRRTLVQCTVLSLQDTCVFYPCCKGCFSRIDAEQHDATRYRCSKCGYRCMREQIEYRYRLSLRVTRNRCIFGVTVFGNSLNQFFGIHASGLQKLVETEPSTRSTLLVKAVKDCFIGKHFIFGIKLSGAENGRFFEGHHTNGSNIGETSQFIASQIILPNAENLAGCTVVRYYQCLLQKASELEPDCSKCCRLPASILFLIPSQSPTSSFSNSSLFASGFLSQSLLRSKHQDCTLSPTPPFEQSLGLLTSSAEQEEGCSSQESVDENSRLKDNSTESFPSESGGLGSQKVKTPPLPLELSFYDSPSFARNSNSSVRSVVGSSLGVNTWCGSSQPGQNSCSLTQKEFYTRQHTRTLLSSSLVWEDLPFSESLAEFLCEENKNVDDVGETGPSLNVNYQKKIKTFLENTKLASGSTSASQRKVQVTTSNSLSLLDVTNVLSPDRRDGRDLSDQVCETPVKSCNQEDDKASLCLEEEQHEGGSYNCSADLFGNSFMISINTETSNVENLKTNVDTPFSKTGCQHLTNKHTHVSHVTPHKREEAKTECRIRNSLILQETHDFEFVPPSQSTPVVKVHLTQSPSFKNLTGESTKENVTDSMTFSKRSHRLSPEKRFRKPDKNKSHVQVGKHGKLQRRNLNLESVKSLNPKLDLQASDVTVCNLEDDEGIVAPTPAGKTQLSMSLRRRRHSESSSSDLGSSWRGRQEDGVDLKRPVLDQTLTSSHRGLPQKGDSANETVFKGVLDGSDVDDESQTCDWSRDLFSDSI
ncbi:uncharacterized protein ddias [Melanotaenia boesemani]|uniref:uncharacterized protein ddias n=1 Tax=Melanotaenia boesemani TaxID=1250792 RepID=UPI001C04D836|nr:uncharacterized protein ddias [Melanotaenia boesemani]